MACHFSAESVTEKQNLREHISGSEALDVLDAIQICHEISSLDALRNFTESLTTLLPLDYLVSSLVETDSSGKVVNHTTLNTSYPEEWLDLYFKNQFELIDPVINHFFNHYEFSYWRSNPDQIESSDKFLAMAHDFNIDRGCVYGCKTTEGSGGTIFSFCGDKLTHQRHESIIKLIIPHIDIKFRQFSLKTKPKLSSLTDREVEVLNWVKSGKTNWEISAILNISERTVKFHVASVSQKLNTVNRSQAVAAAIAIGAIEC